MIFLACFLLSLFFVGAAEPVEKTGAGITIFQISTFSGSFQDRLATETKALEEFSRSGFQLQQLQTQGSKETLPNIVAEVNKSKSSFVVFLDANSATALAGKIQAPWMAISRSKKILSPLFEKQQIQIGNNVVFETLPAPQSIAEAIGRLKPLPTRLGVVYTPDESVSREFVEGLKQAIGKGSEANIDFVACPLKFGACRNAMEFESALQDSFSSLEKGTPLLVLPETNTLKFAFAFDSFARKHNLGLIGLDALDFQESLFSLAYSPKAIAEKCIRVAKQQPGAPSNSFTVLPDLTIDPSHLKAMGYSLDTNALKHSSSRKEDVLHLGTVSIPTR